LPSPSVLLRELELLRARFGDGFATRKLELLQALEAARMPSARAVARLHEAACFLRAYPDDARVLAAVERLLARFAARPDLRRHRARLEDSGIAGTDTFFPFFAPTASWLARRWGERLTIDWPSFDTKSRLEELLPLLVTWSETPALDEVELGLRRWIERLKGPNETDAAFLVRRVEALEASEPVREHLWHDLAPTLRLAPGPVTPSRTRAKLPGLPVHFRRGPLRRERPDLWRELRRPPRSIRSVPPAEGRRIIDLAREAMVARARDLDAFAYGDPRDVRLADCGEGLVFACIGLVPERRLLLEAVYGFLTLKNGLPIGYVLTSALNRSSEIAYNVFDTWRGGEAAWIYGRVLATTRALFGSEVFTVYPYQLGHGNEEGLRSGAWWFYQKLGLRPRDPGALRLMDRELARMRRDPRHRSSRATLKRLAEHNVFLERGRPRGDVIGAFPLGAIGLAASAHLAERFGSDRERGERVLADEAARRLGAGSWRGLSRGERLAWRRWAPLVAVLPGLETWSAAERRALAAVVRAKGGRRESDFVRRFDAHAALRASLTGLASQERNH
jgi:hypothetical protein